MYTNKSIRLVSKSLAILALIQRVNNNIADLQSRQLSYRQNPMYHALGERTLATSIENKKFIAERLTRYYVNTINQVNAEALKQCFPVAA